MRPGERASRLLDVMVRASAALNSARDLRTLMRQLVELGIELVGADAGGWGLVDGDAVQMDERYDAGAWIPAAHRYGRDDPGAPAIAWRTRRLFVTNAAASADGVRPEVIAELGVGSLAVLPLLDDHGAVLGLFGLSHRAGGGAFADDDLEVLGGLAAIAATALANELVRQRIERAERHAAVLAEVGVELARSLDLDVTMPAVAHALVPAVADWCTVTVGGPDDLQRRSAIVHKDPAAAPLVDEYQRDYGPSGHRSRQLTDVVTTATPSFQPEVPDLVLAAAAQSPRHLAILRALGCASCILVPMTVRGQALGVLSLMRGPDAPRFTEDDFAFARELGARAALAVDNAQRFEAERRALETARGSEERWRLLAESSAVLASTLDAQHAFDRLGALLVPRVADWCTFDLLEPDGRTIRRVGTYHQDAARARAAHELITRYPPRLDDEIAVGAVIRTGRSEHVRRITEGTLDAVAYDDAHRAATAVTLGGSYVVVPIAGPSRVHGAMSLLQRDSGRVIDARDVFFCEDIGRRAGAAIENARLYRAAEEARRRATELQGVTAALSGSRTPREVAEVVVAAAVAILDGTTGVVAVVGEGGSMDVIGAAGTRVPDRPMRLAPDARLPIASAVRTGELVWCDDRAALAAFPDAMPVVEFAGVHAGGAVPLVYEDRVIGAMGVSLGREHALSAEEREFLTAIARQCAQALERARLYEDAERARAEAEDANRAKDAFLAMLGHELRNPLAPIVTAVEIMKMRGDAPRERAVIERQTAHLVRLVDDLLDVSRVVRGKVELRLAPLDLAHVIAKATEIAGPLLDDRRHRLVADVARGLRVHGDEVRLAQVFANLLTNAARYTPPEGRIAVRAVRDGDDAVVEIEDNGRGIEPDLLPRIFELFVQGPRAVDRREGGLGIGLTLVRTLVALHGGTVAAHSAGPGQGSRFVVRLPLDPASPRAPSLGVASSSARSGRRRVLVVDDNADAADVLAELLRIEGHEVIVAHDPLEAIALARAGAPDVALLDIGLPTLDGYQLLAELRRLPGGDAMRAFALTGYGQDHDRARSEAAGFVAHLIKPIDPAALLRAISPPP